MWPYGANVRPHSPHVDVSFPFAPLAPSTELRCPRLGPPSLARRASLDARTRASIRACFAGSFAYLRMYPRMRRRPPSVRHASEQYRKARLAAVNFLPHSLHSRLRSPPTALSALAVHRLQQAWCVPPYGANVRPHTWHAFDAAIAVRADWGV